MPGLKASSYCSIHNTAKLGVGAYYGVPDDIKAAARKYVPDELLEIVDRFEGGL